MIDIILNIIFPLFGSINRPILKPKNKNLHRGLWINYFHFVLKEINDDFQSENPKLAKPFWI